MAISVDIVEETAVSALVRHMPRAHAEQQVRVLVEAELRGISSHGLLRLPRIVRRIESGASDPAAGGTHHWRAGAFLEVDGGRGLGPVVALNTIDALERRVERTGVALAAVRNSNHVGMLGYYAERAARKGFAMIAMTTSEALVHPWGGRRALIGTNPIAFGLPVGNGEIFMTDTATSLVSMGKIHDYANRGWPLPEGWALDASGQPTTDAAAARDGAIAPFGGAKGYALGLAIELLVSSLTGAAIGRDVAGTLDDDHVCNKGDVFILMDGARADLTGYLQMLRDEVPAEGVDRVRVPGERARDSRAARRRDGIDLPEALWREIRALAQET